MEWEGRGVIFSNSRRSEFDGSLESIRQCRDRSSRTLFTIVPGDEKIETYDIYVI